MGNITKFTGLMTVAASVALSACATNIGPETAKVGAPTEITMEAVTYASEPGALHGTFTRPAGAGPFPVVVFQAGSGPTDRDGNQPGAMNNSLKMLGDGLAERGIASLRIDKRGIGESAAAAVSEDTLRFETYADDMAAWATSMDARDDTGDVAFLGHSEGGALAILAAQQFAPSHLVLVATPGHRGSDIIRTQLEGKLPPALAAKTEETLVKLESSELAPDAPPELGALFRASVQPYLISWFKHDPAEGLKALSAPVLVVQGTTDIQISVSDAERLAEASDGELVIIEGMNHVLKDAPADQAANVAVYNQPDIPLSDGVVDTIADFITGK